MKKTYTSVKIACAALAAALTLSAFGFGLSSHANAKADAPQLVEDAQLFSFFGGEHQNPSKWVKLKM